MHYMKVILTELFLRDMMFGSYNVVRFVIVVIFQFDVTRSDFSFFPNQDTWTRAATL